MNAKRKNTGEKTSKTYVSGLVILSTIETMASFGSLGEEVLEKFGVEKIEEDKQYPYELRAAIHKSALDRFGEIALIAFGYHDSEMHMHDLNEVLDAAYPNSKRIFESNDEHAKRVQLAEILKLWTETCDQLVKSVSRTDANIQYGNGVEQLGATRFQLQATLAAELHQEPFYRGVTDYAFMKYLGKYWSYSIQYLASESVTGYGFSTFCWEVNFERKNTTISEDAILWAQKMFIRDELMKSVLNDSEKQKRRAERLSNSVSKYIPAQIHDALFEGKYDTEITTRRKKLTIFFSDIKNFTSTSEGLQPEDLTKYLNEYFSEMTAIALGCGATVDKYIGDAMMVFFGDPETKGEKEDARACVEMALRMQERMMELQKKWRNEGFADPFQVRMGINTGYCNVGNFGSDQRLTYTIIGGEVNVAQRLEGNADSNGILMSYETYAHAKDMIDVEEEETITMKGINREIKVFSVIERKSKVKNKKAVGAKKPSKKELSEIDQIKQDSKEFKQEIRQELALIKLQLTELLNE